MGPKIKVSGTVSNFSKTNKNEVKEKSSQFFLTINTNQSYKDGDTNIENDTEVFTEIIENFLNNIGSFVKIPAGKTFDDDVKDVDVQYIIERGNKKGQIHCHAFVKFKHTTDVKLDFAKIKTTIADDLGLNNIYFNSKMVHNNSKSVLEYIDKYIDK